jgi:ADP-heptose:LPS heptosyltransferase
MNRSGIWKKSEESEMTFVGFQAGARSLDIVDEATHDAFSSRLNDLLLDFDLDLPEDASGANYLLTLSNSEIKSQQDLIWPLEQNIHRIALLCSPAIRDYVFTLPALEALRFAYPQAEIVYLGYPWHQEFLSSRAGPVDRVEIVPSIIESFEGRDYPVYLQGMHSFFERMQAEHFDLAIQLHGDSKYSQAFIGELGARLTIGLQGADTSSLDRCVPFHYYQNEVLLYLEVVSLVGATPRTVMPRIQVTCQDLDEASWVLPIDPRPFVILHPGAGDPRKRWPLEKFAAVGNAIAWSGAGMVIIGTPAEKEIADRLVRLMSAEVINLCGQTSINGLTGLLYRASVVVSNDSGPLHLAAAVGTPTVGIYWLGNAIMAAPTTRSYHRPAIAWRIHCPVCGLDTTRNDCGHDVSWVADISQEEVIESAIELLRLNQNPVDLVSS